MRILLATNHPYFPQISGGAQSSMNQIATSLVRRGHCVAVLCGLTGAGIFGLKRRVLLKLGSSNVVADNTLGYRVYRAWDANAAMKEAVASFKPDVVVPQSGSPVPLSKAARDQGIPSVIYFRNVEHDDFGGSPRESADAYIANSRFTAGMLLDEFDIQATVIPPMVDPEKYETCTSRRYITFINPHPHKGRDIAFGIAQSCPDLEFLFVKAWTLSPEHERELRDFASQNPNVTVSESVPDMREIYSQTKIIIAPSKWQEAWGRIATEAHYSGIPVVAAAVGGLPEAVGPGGVMLPVDASIEDWASTVRSVACDGDRYAALSRAAKDYSCRDEMKLDTQIDAFLDVCRTVVQRVPELRALDLV